MPDCLQCGKKLTLFNRSMLLCRQCATEDHRTRRKLALRLTRGYRPEASSIYVSYRRSDSQAEATEIAIALADRFTESRVLRDIDCVPSGLPFFVAVREAIADAGIMLVVVGPSWLTSETPSGRRRLKDPSDEIRVEIQTALRARLPIVCVTVSGASKPSSLDLPASLATLATRTWLELRPPPDRDEDVNRLCSRLEAMLKGSAGRDARDPDEPEHALLRLEKDWEIEQQRHHTFLGGTPSRMGVLISLLIGLMLIWFGAQGLVAATLSDTVSLAMMVLGVYGPVFALFRYRKFRRVDSLFRDRRADLKAKLDEDAQTEAA